MHSLALIVHNDLRQAQTQFPRLESFGIKPYAVGTLQRALEVLAQWSFDVVLLDGAEQDDLLGVITELKASAVPLVVLTNGMDEAVQIRCLEAGASEVVPRPENSQLTALVLRRIIELGAGRPRAPADVHVGPLYLDVRRSKAIVGGDNLELTRQQFEITLLLAVRVGEFVSRQLLAGASRQRIEKGSRSIDVQVSKIRKKLRDRGARSLTIDGVYGKGYCLTDHGAGVPTHEQELDCLS